MKAVEEYIKNYTRNCCNEFSETKSDGLGGYISRKGFAPWLTPDEAMKAAKIAREETIKEVCEYLSKNYLIKTTEPLRWVSIDKVFDDLKKHLDGKA